MGRIISNGIDFSGLNLLTPMCFSMDERVVGCWIDGKPLYQKTIDCGYCPNNDSKSVAHEISNLEKVVSIDGIGINTSSGLSVSPIPYVNRTSLDSQIQLLVNGGNVVIATGSDQRNRYAYVTIYYTKTTDTAGSGLWTPDGLVAQHYSTSEHVVGTWIDGKTLYERTVEITHTFITGDNDIVVSSSASSIGAIIDCNYTFAKSNSKDIIKEHPSLQATELYINNSDNIILYIACSNASGVSTINKIRITYQYTKSS